MDVQVKSLRRTVVALGLLVSACSSVEPVDRSTGVVTTENPAGPAQRPVAIVISSNDENYQAVASALVARGGHDYTKYSLDNASGQVIAELIAQRGIEDVVTVGEQAARSIRPSDGFNVYYCQVFAELEFQSSGYRGVSAVPPFALQLAHWRTAKPGLNAVGVVASSKMKLYVEELRAAAAEIGISFSYEQVENDKEALFVFQRMVPEIDGYIFLPDVQILSPQIVRDMMDYGLKHGISMLTYSPAIASLGAAVYIAVDAADIADQIARLLDADADVHRLGLSRVGNTHNLDLAVRPR